MCIRIGDVYSLLGLEVNWNIETALILFKYLLIFIRDTTIYLLVKVHFQAEPGNISYFTLRIIPILSVAAISSDH